MSVSNNSNPVSQVFNKTLGEIKKADTEVKTLTKSLIHKLSGSKEEISDNAGEKGSLFLNKLCGYVPKLLQYTPAVVAARGLAIGCVSLGRLGKSESVSSTTSKQESLSPLESAGKGMEAARNGLEALGQNPPVAEEKAARAKLEEAIIRYEALKANELLPGANDLSKSISNTPANEEASVKEEPKEEALENDTSSKVLDASHKVELAKSDSSKLEEAKEERTEAEEVSNLVKNKKLDKQDRKALELAYNNMIVWQGRKKEFEADKELDIEEYGVAEPHRDEMIRQATEQLNVAVKKYEEWKELLQNRL
ncbi:MAG: hypothetical protein ACXWM7_04665 [Parachlamydiaceae bacterium]